MERLDAFMARANAAYYARQDPFADFTTSPEISQVFGEILGLWAAIVWQAMGAPTPVAFSEAGPGRGTLMADALRAIGQTVPAFADAAKIHLIETSRRLRAAQAQLIPMATWHDSLESLPAGPLLLLANEFLDALPIRQFVRRGDGWHERFVQNGAFVEQPAIDEAPEGDAPKGEIAEIGGAARKFVAALARRIVTDGGAALVIDYGPERGAWGESLQAIKDRQPTDPLKTPGDADLTAHVDFSALAALAVAEGAVVHGPLPQGVFLMRLGLYQRTERLARGQPATFALRLIEGARRLAEPDRMGRLFKAMAICHPDLPIPPGFAE